MFDSIPERYFVKEIDKKEAQEINIKNHYLHRKAPCSQAFGLFDRNNNDSVVGILLFGVSASSTLLKGVCGPDEAKNVMELTRLWIEDGTPKNTESFFIGQCIKMCSREIIVSFAQIDAGHVGTVYQATNWIYTGLSTKFKDPKLRGKEHLHHTSWAHSVKGSDGKSYIKMQNGELKPYGTAALKEKYGDELYFAERPRKHRYVFVNAKSKKRRKEIMKKLKYKILEYPKKSAI